MNTSRPMEKTGGYFSAELRESRSPWFKQSMPFITISRESCSGGSSLAEMLVKKLNAEGGTGPAWSILGGNVVDKMLAANHLPGGLARYLPEDKVPEVNATIGEIVGLHPNLWELLQKTNATLRHLAKGGHVILVGRGANLATADIPGGIHVRLVAPPDFRARYYAQRFGVPEAEALEHNAKCDASRRRYVQAHFNASIENAAAYDLVLNAARVPLAEAADLVIAHLRAHAPVAA